FGKFKDFTDWASSFYGNQDKFFKMASFRKSVMEDGLTDWQAMRKAAYYFIDYSDMPKAIEFIKNAPFGQPFISFNYGISRPLAKTLLEDPKKIGDFFKMMRDVQKAHPGNRQIDDRTKFEENLPTWVQENRELYMAFADPNNPNKAEVINWEYVIPRGLIEDFDGYYDFILGMAGKKGAKSLESIRTVPLMNAPYVTIPSDIIYNQSRFTGREIVNMNDSPSTQLFKRMEYVWKQVAPNWPGLPWSYNTDMFQNAGFFPRLGERGEIFFETTERGEEKGALRALLNNFGIKSLPVDLEAEAVKKIKAKKWNLIELNKLMNQVKRSKFLPEAEKEKQIEELKEQRKRIQAGEV
ncbi:hypothetical protein CL633_02445, partial [bacterium]|nr:hypothetical protein [bacterium]